MTPDAEGNSEFPAAREGARADAGEKRDIWSLLETDLGWFGYHRVPQQAETLIRRAPLPESHRALIGRVVKRTRLWRRERADVARELIAHFADGLEAGSRAEELIRSFGDEKRAAKLIRRGKRRNRPLIWHAWRRGWQGMGCVLLLIVAVYLYYGVQVWTATPTIRRNYVEELNAPLLALRDEDRGWPLVRLAALDLFDDQLVILDHSGRTTWVDVLQAEPGTDRWAATAQYVEAHRPTLNLLREASAKPAVGRRLVLDDMEDRAHGLLSSAGSEVSAAAADNPMLSGVLLPHLGALRDCSTLLLADVRVAVHEHRGSTASQSVRACFWIAQSLSEDPFLIGRNVGRSILEEACNVLDEALEQRPEVFGDAEWRNVAHQLSACRAADGFVANFQDQHLMFDDMLQRLFSDNGRGSGRITRDGLKLLRTYTVANSADRLQSLSGDASVPIAAAIIADRHSQREMFEQLLRANAMFAARPLWEQPTQAVIDEMIEKPMASSLSRMRFAPIDAMLPSLRGVYFRGQRTLQRRDATLVAVALELFHRDHGRYPTLLHELVPQFLPALPPDRHTGRALNYTLRGGEPVLYSTGIDLDDDCGATPVEARGSLLSASNWTHPTDLEQLKKVHPESIPNGDWILYPPSMARGN